MNESKVEKNSYWKKVAEEIILLRIVDEPFYEKYRNKNKRDTKITHYCKREGCGDRLRNTVHIDGIIIWEETAVFKHKCKYTSEDKD